MSSIQHALPALFCIALAIAGCNGQNTAGDEQMLAQVERLRSRLERLESDIRRQSKKIDELGRQLEKSASDLAEIRRREELAAKQRAVAERAAAEKAEAEAAQGQADGGEEGQTVADAGEEEPPSRPGAIAFDQFTLKVQKALKRAGYDPGPIDGKKGPKTTRALQAFQKEHSVPQTGMADEETWALLKRNLE